MEIGRILRYCRALHNLTQSEVAELSGINEKYLGRIERGESIPTIDKVAQLCLAFDIRLIDMLAISPEKADLNVKLTSESNKVPLPKVAYYCNCCGCSFQPAISDCDINEITCPECGCIFDADNGFIEKSITY